MVSSAAATPDAYLAELPPDRRPMVEALRATILEHLPDGYEEMMLFGGLSYVVPDGTAGNTTGKPMVGVGLVAQKRYVSVYLMGCYGDEAQRDRFVTAWQATGLRLDMGKSCVRVRRLEDIPLDLVGDAVSWTSPEELVAAYVAAHPR